MPSRNCADKLLPVVRCCQQVENCFVKLYLSKNSLSKNGSVISRAFSSASHFT